MSKTGLTKNCHLPAISHGIIRSPFLLWSFHERTFPSMILAELTRWSNINLARNLPPPAEITRPLLPRLVLSRAELQDRLWRKAQAIEEG